MRIVDLETMSTKQFIAALSAEFDGADLSTRKKFIKSNITLIIDDMAKDADGMGDAAGEGGDDGDSVVDSSDEELEDDKEVVDLKPKRRGGGGGLSAVKEISDDLAAFLDSGKHMARTAIVKSLWEYIKKNNLQNPNDKQSN